MKCKNSTVFCLILLGLIGLNCAQIILYFDEQNGVNDPGNLCTDGENPCKSFAVFKSSDGFVDTFAGINDTSADTDLIFSMKGTFNSPDTLRATLNSQNPLALNITSFGDSAILDPVDSNPANFTWDGLGSFSLHNLEITNTEVKVTAAYFYLGKIFGTQFSARGPAIDAKDCKWEHAAVAIWAYLDLQIDGCQFSQPEDSVNYPGSGIMMATPPSGGDPPSSLSISNTQFKWNVGYLGGAIFINASQSANSLSVFIFESKFEHNQADLGGAIYISHPNPNISIANCDFFRNTARHDPANDAGGQGGAIFIGQLQTAPTKDTVQIINNQFRNNTAFKDAGAVWMDLFGGDFSGSKFSGNTLPDVNFEYASECRAQDCKYCGGDICTEGQGYFVCVGPATSYIPCNSTENTGQYCYLFPDLSQQCKCPEGTKGKNCDVPDYSTSYAAPSTNSHDPGNHPAKPNHTALIVVLTLLGLAVFSGALYGYFYYRSRHNYQTL